MKTVNYKNSYCNFANLHGGLHKQYHDHEYGFPLNSDEELFGRLILEINQAGLNWGLILKKKNNFKQVYSDFNINKIANYSENDKKRILSDARVIRNKLKVNAVIYNAQKVLVLQKEYGSFNGWLIDNSKNTKEQWVKLFKLTFKFTGGEITNEFLTSTGFLEGAHHPDCDIYHQVLEKQPQWSRG